MQGASRPLSASQGTPGSLARRAREPRKARPGGLRRRVRRGGVLQAAAPRRASCKAPTHDGDEEYDYDDDDEDLKKLLQACEGSATCEGAIPCGRVLLWRACSRMDELPLWAREEPKLMSCHSIPFSEEPELKWNSPRIKGLRD